MVICLLLGAEAAEALISLVKDLFSGIRFAQIAFNAGICQQEQTCDQAGFRRIDGRSGVRAVAVCVEREAASRAA